MIPRRFLSVASAFSFFSQACSAETITLTTHVSACSATYTSGTSTTVIESTVTVQPTPWTDVAANGGAPFVIRLEQVDASGYPDQDPAPYWLTYNGNTTTNSSLAAVYFITEGRLSTQNGSHVATNINVVDQAFGITDYPLPINTTFSVRNRMLNWTYPLFTNGTAQFYKLPPGLLDNALILAKFLGPMEAQRSWSPVILYVEPLVNNGTGVTPSVSSQASGSPLSTVSGLLPSSVASSSGTVAQSSISGPSASSSAAVAASSIQSQLSSQLSSVASGASSASSMASMSSQSPSAISSGPVSVSSMQSMASSSASSVLSSIAAGVSSVPAGVSSSAVGGASSSATSIPLSGSASISGIGPVIIPSSSGVSTTTIPAAVSSAGSSSASSASSSATPTTLPPQTTYTCPSSDNQMVQANTGGMYTIGCNEEVSGGGVLAGSAPDFNGCMTLCDQTTGCTAWTFNGNCYLKTGASSSEFSFQPGTQGTVSGIRSVPARPGGTGPSSSSLVSSAGQSSFSVARPSSSSAVPAVSSISPAVSSVAPVSSVSAASSRVSSSTPGMSSSAPASVISSSASSIRSSVSSALSSVVSSVRSSATSVGSSATSVVSSASSAASAASSSRAASSSAAASSSSSRTSSAPAAASSIADSTYSCPAVNGTSVLASTGGTYEIRCAGETTGGGTLAGAARDFNHCMTLCDQRAGCGAWTYTGNCYLKLSGTIRFQTGTFPANQVAGIRNGQASGAPSSAPAAAVSSTAVAASSSVPVSYATAISSATSAPSSAPSQVSYSCPSVDGQTVVDSTGGTYTIKCDSDTTSGGQLAGPAADFNACMTKCDNTAGCGGWTYQGNCYLKLAGDLQFVNAPAGQVAGIRNGQAVGAGSVTSTSSSVAPVFTPSGSAVPKCPAIDGTTVTDPIGARYGVSCGGDSQGRLITNVGATGGGIQDCFLACDRTDQCTAFTYSGDSTMTLGTCYLKYEAGAVSSSGVDTIALAILVSPAPGGAGAASMTSSASSVPVAASSSRAAASSAPAAASSSRAAASSAAASSAAAATTPLPSGGGSPTVVNPDGSTSTYNGLLASPTRCDFGDPLNTEEDDTYCEVDLPFSMRIYQGSSTKTFPSTNGLLSLDQGSIIYNNAPGLPNQFLPPNTAAPFFDDLIKNGDNLDMGIFFQTTATTVTYEYRLARGGTYENYHFTLSYDSTKPGVFVYRYYEIGGDQGSGSANIGIQGLAADGKTATAVNFALNKLGAVVVGSTLTCDTSVTPANCVRS
ncbi:hypothetical protein D6D21_08400 [Aureobasidium pullulans]|uniref:Apple domain-containing protein n=1 Tax=Aureobasidium pullulans TaxID=5580 RepID=A0AB74IQ65_AURPU|nr:hypothetical protein D6D21_08400 [Aureobasidium pullulans]